MVKLNLRQIQIGLAALVLASSAAARAESQPTGTRGTPIIFSAPKTDTVSSNLNELRSPTPAFRQLEEGLKKPFELFDPAKSGADPRPATRKFVPPAPQNKKSVKELMNERAEEMFLNSEPTDTGDEEFFTGAEEGWDPYRKHPKNSLDRYYDRLERNRTDLTNRTSGSDLFGDKSAGAGADDFLLNSKSAGGLTAEGKPSAQTLRDLSLQNSGPDSLSADRAQRSFISGYESKPAETGFSYRQTKESRLEAFKQLLEGPAYKARTTAAGAQPNATSPRSPTTLSPYGATPPAWSSTKPAPQPVTSSSFRKSAGMIGTPGKPEGLPDFASGPTGLNPITVTPQANPLPPPTFNPPKRRF